jgi:amino acid adenylation domain-containing protein
MKNEPGNHSHTGEGKAPLSHKEKLALLKSRLQEKAGEERFYPLSYNQQSIWAFHQANPSLSSYNMKFSARICGPLATAALQRVFQKILGRHPILTTTYSSSENGPVQKPGGCPALSFTEVESPGLDDSQLKVQVQAAYRQPFNLETGPVFRVHLFKCSAEDHVLLVTMHHIASDGWSLFILLDELKKLYEAEVKGTAAALPPLQSGYTDFVKAQQEFTGGEKGNNALRYWKEQLSGELPLLQLPVCRPREAVQKHEGATYLFRLQKELALRLKKFAQAENVTLHTLFLAAYQALLHRYSGQEDIIVGVPVNERDLSCQATVGHFINPISVRSRFDDDPSFGTLLQRVKNALFGGLNYKEYPFPLVVKHASQRRDPGYSPVFQALIVMQKIPQSQEVGKLFLFGSEERVEWTEGLRLQTFDFPEQEGQFDLVLELREHGDDVFCALKYDTALFNRAAVADMSGVFTCLLDSVIQNPAKPVSVLELMRREEKEELLHTGTIPVFASGKCMHRLFEEQAARTPQAVALTLDGKHLTYDEVNRRANRLARQLLQKGVQPDQLVGLLMDRSFELVIGILAILKAGGAYLPLDPDYPMERLLFILHDAGTKALVSKKEFFSLLPQQPDGIGLLLLDEASPATTGEEENLNLELSSHNLAYAIYTSGSTGLPKGVLIPHANIHRLFTATQEWFGFAATDTWTLFHSFAFDFSVWEIWGALAYGGRLVIVPYLDSRSPEAFYRLLVNEKVTVLNQTPSAFRQVMATDQAYGSNELSLRYVIFGGEQLDDTSLRSWYDRHPDDHPRLVNMYGITETTVHVTYKKLAKADAWHPAHSIGRPIPDLQVHILDKNAQPVPAGIPGEMYVGGAGLAQGYLNRPELTAERFCYPLEEKPSLRLYKTGDLGLRLPNGEIAYLGRNDAQVKLRGFRIELGEIEGQLKTFPGISDALAHVVTSSAGAQLAAYFIPAQEAAIEPGELRTYLKQRLPAHMVPAHFIAISSIPLTAHGKTDRQALPLPEAEENTVSVHDVPTSENELILAAIWKEVLNKQQIGVHDNFFELGGDSINALQIIGKAKEKGLYFSVKDLFQCQTLSSLAAACNATANEKAAPKLAPYALLKPGQLPNIPEGVEDAYPLSALQLGMVYHTVAGGEDSFIYHNINSFHLEGAFSQEFLEEAIRLLVQRHAILRTRIDLHHYDEPIQFVQRQVEVPLTVEDLSRLKAEEQENIYNSWFEKEKRSGFDLSSAPLFRFHVFVFSSSRFVLTLTEHHAILDGWSMSSMMSEVLRNYHTLLSGETLAPAAPPASSFRDYIAAEKEIMSSADAKSFWELQLKDISVGCVPRWPAAYRNEQVSETKYNVSLPDDLSVQLSQLSHQLGVPLKTVLLSAHLYVLSLLFNRPGVVSGVVTNGRFEEAEGDEVLGLFLNALPFPAQLSGGSWIQFIKSVLQKETALLAYRRFPLLELERLKKEKHLFEVLFNFTHFHVYGLASKLDRLRFIEARFFERTNYALTVHFNKHPLDAKVSLDISFDPARITAEQVEHIGFVYRQVLSAIAANPHGHYESFCLPQESILAGSEIYPEGDEQPLPVEEFLSHHVQPESEVITMQVLGPFHQPCTTGLPGQLYLNGLPVEAEVFSLPDGNLCFYKPYDPYARQRRYWLQELDNLPAHLFPAWAGRETPGDVHVLPGAISGTLYGDAKACAASSAVSLPGMLMTALHLTAGFHTGSNDVVAGLIVKEGVHTESGNIIPVRIVIDDAKSFSELAKELERKITEGLRQACPAALLENDLQLSSGLAHITAAFAGMEAGWKDSFGRRVILDDAVQKDVPLLFAFTAQEEEISIHLRYNSQAMESAAAGKLLANFLDVLEQAVKAPSAPLSGIELKLTGEEQEEQDAFLRSMFEL